MKTIQILAISGSLRAKSSNSTVLKAAQILSRDAVNLTLYSDLANLPHFNPDLDLEPFPKVVTSFRQQVKYSDGILISSPEYAHGVPGSLKNALDWLVSTIEFPGKPIALINTNPRVTIAQAALREILNTMSAKIVEPANITLDIAGKGLDTKEIVANSMLSSQLS